MAMTKNTMTQDCKMMETREGETGETTVEAEGKETKRRESVSSIFTHIAWW
jgi:hypothetical protein